MKYPSSLCFQWHSWLNFCCLLVTSRWEGQPVVFWHPFVNFRFCRFLSKGPEGSPGLFLPLEGNRRDILAREGHRIYLLQLQFQILSEFSWLFFPRKWYHNLLLDSLFTLFLLVFLVLHCGNYLAFWGCWMPYIFGDSVRVIGSDFATRSTK
uniref:Uncharacterized protein n=1 Tax=Opuntia streptacantha TaxID=393608 RepID=A0A7C9EHP6_OPUST